MSRRALQNFILSHEAAFAALLLVLGLALRAVCLGELPYGLNQDEASAGYDAWALLNYGIDRCGNSWPVLLEAWGSGQNVLYSILSLPFIALFGLNVVSFRLVAVICGEGALFVFWRLARRCRGAGFGLTALFTLAVCPWHIMASRWALESNLLPFFLLLGIYFTVLAREREWALIGAAAALGLSLYAYGTAWFFLPPYLIAAVVWLRKRLRPASFLVSLGLFLLIALPITLCQVINALGLEGFTVLGVTIPRLTEARQSATTVFGGGGLSAVGENLRTLLGILWTGSDGLAYNALPGRGLYYFFGLPLIVIGFAFSLGTRKDCVPEAPLRFSVIIALCAACLISGNINRLNMLWLPLAWFMALGLHIILRRLGSWGALPVAAVLLCLCLFLSDYSAHFGRDGSSGSYFPGLGEAIGYVEAQSPDSVYITTSVNAPYIFALFYTETPPEEFLATVDYINPDGAFRAVRSFGHFRFGEAEAAEGEYLILREDETGGREILAAFGDFRVCKGTE